MVLGKAKGVCTSVSLGEKERGERERGGGRGEREKWGRKGGRERGGRREGGRERERGSEFVRERETYREKHCNNVPLLIAVSVTVSNLLTAVHLTVHHCQIQSL